MTEHSRDREKNLTVSDGDHDSFLRGTHSHGPEATKQLTKATLDAKCQSAVIVVICNIIRKNYTFSPWEPLYFSS